MNLNSRSLKSSLVSCVKRGRCNESHVRVLLPTIPEIEPSESGIASTFTASLPEKLDIDCRRETAIELAIELVKAKIEDIRIRRRTQDYIDTQNHWYALHSLFRAGAISVSFCI